MSTDPDQQTALTADDWRREPLPDPFDDRAVQERIARLIAKAAEAAGQDSRDPDAARGAS